MPNGRGEKPARGTPSTRAPRGKGLLSRKRPGTTGGAPVQASENPYRPYRGVGEAAGPYVSSARRSRRPRTPYMAPPSANGDTTTLDQRHHPFSLFHDGNAGHLWRGEVTSLLGDAILATGVLMWLLQLTGSPGDVALAVFAMALPALLAIPLAVPLQNVAEPGTPLAWIGRLRVLCTLGFVIMHFFVNPNLVVPVYLLLFAVGFLGRLRVGGRVAAERACLAPGEVELVANDLHIGAALASVLGPLLGTALFLLGASHILLVALGALICYLLSSNSENFLDALPVERRAYMYAVPLPASEASAPSAQSAQSMASGTHQHTRVRSAVVATPDDPATERERRLPVWFTEGPHSVGQGIADIRGGLTLAGNTSGGGSAIGVISFLAFISGGLTAILLPYLVFGLGLSSYELGPVLAAEGAGLALSVSLSAQGRARPAGRVLLGFLGTALGIGLLIALRRAPFIYVGGLIYGLSGGLAVLAAREVLHARHSGPEMRGIGAGEEFIAALAATIGALVLPLIAFGATIFPRTGPLTRFFPGWPLTDVLLATALALVLAGLFYFVRLRAGPANPDDEKNAKNASGTRKRRATAEPDEGTIGRLFAQEPESGLDDDDDADVGRRGSRGLLGRGRRGQMRRSSADDEYDDERGSAYSRSGGGPRFPRFGASRSLGRDGYDDGGDGGYDDYDDYDDR